MKNKETEEIENAVKKMVSQFQEMHITVGIQVFVTTKIGANCGAYSYGDGDWYSRFGYISEWLEMQKERCRQYIRQEDSK